MTTLFTPEQIAQLEIYLNQIEHSGSTQGAAVEAYQYLLGLISETDSSGVPQPKAGVPMASWLWIKGAIGVNSGASGFGHFIRQYTLAQAEIRGLTVDVDLASNRIAAKVLEDIINRNAIPSINGIGERDAAAATGEFFNDNRGAWSGNLLFIVLGTSQFATEYLIGSPDAGYEIAASLKAFGAATGQTYGTPEALAAGMIEIWRTVYANGSVFSTVNDVVHILEQMEARLTDLYGLSGTWVLDSLNAGLGTEGADDNGVDNEAFIHMGDGDDLYDVVDESSVIDGGKGYDTIDIGFVTSQATLELYSADSQGKGIRVEKGDNKIDYIYNFELVKLGHETDTVKVGGSILHGAEKQMRIDAGDGTDILDATGMQDPLLIDLINKRLMDGNGFIAIENFERAQGGAGNDLLIGKDGHVLKGGAGADYLLADSGAVTLDGGAGNDYLEATGEGPVTYVFGRGYGHDVIGSLWPSPGIYHGYDDDKPYWANGLSWDYRWWHQRQNDRIVLRDLTPSDISFIWDHHPIEDGAVDYVREGGFAIIINDTGESLYLGHITVQHNFDDETGQFLWHHFHYDLHHGHTLVGGPGEIFYGTPWNFIEFADGTTRSMEDLVDWFLPSTDMPSSYTSALDEHIAGSSNSNVLSGGGSDGPNVVNGTAGSDRLYGGNGKDTLTGADGDDIILAGNGNDLIVSGLGDTGDDYINGGNGTDTVSFSDATAGVTIDLSAGTASGSEASSDTLISIENAIGGSGHDIIIGTGLDNQLSGGAGSDSLVGADGDDSLIGGSGSDTIVGGHGVDTTIYDTSSAGVFINLSTGTASGGDAEGDVLVEIEHVTGSMFGDLIVGSNSANVLTGLGGNDTLYGGLGRDTLSGGSGDDIYLIDNIEDVILEAADGGFDIVRSSVNYGFLASHVEALVLTGANAINGTGNSRANILLGNSNDNILEGLDGADTLDGGDGVDTAIYIHDSVSVSLATGLGYSGLAEGDVLINIENLTGSWLDDTLEGSAGDNILIGGGGMDTVSYVHASAAVSVNLALSTAQNTGGAGTDTLSGFENLIGSAHSDYLAGTDGANTLIGGAGADRLYGRLGDDTLTGGLGVDRFEFLGGETGRDTITDFTRGEDIIVLTDFELDILQTGVNFMVDAGPTVARATLLYDNLTGILSYDSDGTGAAAAVQMAQLAKRPVVTARDFVILETI